MNSWSIPQVHHLSRELLQERTKVKALSEELENPLNVHRWRKLEGSDPSTYEMIQKIQTLQKRLIAKSEEAVEKDLLIQEREKLYVELKNILARQPGPEVAEQLSIYQVSDISSIIRVQYSAYWGIGTECMALSKHFSARLCTSCCMCDRHSQNVTICAERSLSTGPRSF